MKNILKKIINRRKNLENSRHSEGICPKNLKQEILRFAQYDALCHSEGVSPKNLHRRFFASLRMTYFVILNLFQNIKIFSKSVPHNGENAMRSNHLTAMLRSRMSRFSLTEFRYAHSSAFSLAEVIVLLTIIAIILAMTAPILSRPSNIDEKNLVKKIDETNYLVANGDAQAFNVGLEDSTRTKFRVYDTAPNNMIGTTAEINGNLMIPSKNLTYDDNGKNYARVWTTVDANGYSIINIGDPDKVLFRVSPDGKINILAQPNYNNVNVVNGQTFNPAQDGYLYIDTVASDNIRVTQNKVDCTSGGCTSPNSNYTYIQGVNSIQPSWGSFSTISSNDFNRVIRFDSEGRIHSYPVQIPVQGNRIYNVNCETGKCYFIPLGEADINNYKQITGIYPMERTW